MRCRLGRLRPHPDELRTASASYRVAAISQIDARKWSAAWMTFSSSSALEAVDSAGEKDPPLMITSPQHQQPVSRSIVQPWAGPPSDWRRDLMSCERRLHCTKSGKTEPRSSLRYCGTMTCRSAASRDSSVSLVSGVCTGTLGSPRDYFCPTRRLRSHWTHLVHRSLSFLF